MEIDLTGISVLSPEEVLEKTGSSMNGLSEEEANRRLTEYGHNELTEVKKKPLIYKFIGNFIHLFAILLWVGGALSFFGGMPQLGWAIFAVIIINAVFSFWQEYKAEKAIQALKKLIPAHAKVVRDGELTEILASEIVPGDIVVLGEGDNISADGRLIEEFEMRVNTATLTGESEPVRKTAQPVLRGELGVTEMPNLVFAGTSVSYGSGKAVVASTGMKTEFGKIANLTQTIEEELSPLQKELNKVVKIVAVLATGMGILFFFLGTFVKGLSITAAFVFGIGIIVANVPEGLLPTVTLALAMGVQRMAKRHALIKKLSSVETLGSTTVICTDKTGTLTQNEMTVRQVWVDGMELEASGVGYDPNGKLFHPEKKLTEDELKTVELLMKSATFCNNAKLIPPSDSVSQWTVLGDPTEAALLVTAAKFEFDYLDQLEESPRIYELPFDSKRKRMSTVHMHEFGRIAYVKGAPKEVLHLCNRISTRGGIVELDDSTRNVIVKKNDEYAKSALRVLAMAYREVDVNAQYNAEEVEKDLIFVGLMAMMDPPRTEVEMAVEQCFTAGIKIIMITGDYGLTAESIAKRIGIVKEKARIITGTELDGLSDEVLRETLQRETLIFARVAPEHKMRVVSALKDLGHIVAVTGDGVNDAPALKKADIGVAMGITGTDVAKEAAEMILTDDNFASIVHAIEEGRAVYDNIRRFVTYIFASNIPEIVPFLLMVLLNLPLPLTVMQILAVDLGTDMIPALALGTEAPEPGVMDRPPRKSTERLLNHPLFLRAYGFLGPIEALACMSGFLFMYFTYGWTFVKGVAGLRAIGPDRIMTGGLLNPIYAKATTMTHAGIITTQVGNGMACRTERESVFKIGFFSNKFLLWGILVESVLISILIYVQPFQKIFEHGPLNAIDWLFLVLWIPVIFFADELRKLIGRKYIWKKSM